MNSLEKAKQQIVKKINLVLDDKTMIKESDLVFPPDSKMGDLSLPCFDLAKELKKTPVEISLMLANLSELSSDRIGIESVKAAGPYLNFILDKTALAGELFKEINKSKEKFGWNKDGKNKKVTIEYSNANTHKEYHIGHLRNICYGDAVNRILEANGFKAIPISYINDFGIHVAKTLWALKKFYQKDKLSHRVAENGNKGAFLGNVYVEGAQAVEKNEAVKKEINQLMAKIETRQGAEYKLWQTTRKWSIEQFAKIYRELGVKFVHTTYESEVIDAGRKIVEKLLKDGVLKESQGAVIADLEQYSLGILVVLRSDGTMLYPVADLGLAAARVKKFKPDNSIIVVDIRQSLYFKQLFKVLELIGFKEQMVHLGHEFVKLPSGMMSSRTGNVITYEDLRNELFKRASEETKKRHTDWLEKKINEVAEELTIGAMKFEMIKVSRAATITFEIEKALRFEGFTAAYLQYTGARIQSILRKSEILNPKSETISHREAGSRLREKFKIQNSKFLTEKKEGELIMKLAKYPEIVKVASDKYEPSEIAKYLFELAQEFNDYYHEVPILKAELETRVARLALISAVNQVLANGLNLLGIETMEEM